MVTQFNLNRELSAKETYRHPILGTLRPRQWIKNSFIFAPALFTLRVLDPSTLPALFAGFLGFSAVASAVYTFNDLCDREEDRRHPVKRFRPIAAGKLSTGGAAGLILTALVIGLSLLWWASPIAGGVALGYVLLMGLYSLILRRIQILDVIIIATGFVLRVIVGGVIISEPLSHWLLLCTFTIALFMAMIKRRQEMSGMDEEVSSSDESAVDVGDAEVSRSVLIDYPRKRIIDSWISILAGMTVLCYALYAVDSQTVAKHHTSALIYTLPLVLYGVFRYMQLSYEGRMGEDPTELIIRDPGMKVVVILWVAAVALILFLAGGGGSTPYSV